MDEAIDVTRLCGAQQQDLEDELFEAFREAFAVAESRPSVRSYRACVAAYDAFKSAVDEGGLHEQN